MERKKTYRFRKQRFDKRYLYKFGASSGYFKAQGKEFFLEKT